MMRPLLLILAAQSVVAQPNPAAPPKFELVSIRRSAPSRTAPPWTTSRKLGYNAASGRIDLRVISLMDLLTLAFGVEPYQVQGPEWLFTQTFDISAAAPAGTDRDKVPAMLQSLLEDRFGLKFRREMQKAPIYALEVAPGGSKLKPGIPDEEPDKIGAISTQQANGPNGPVSTASARTFFGIYRLTASNGMVHYEFPNISMQGFCQFLTPALGRGPLEYPVVDMTGLEGRYQLTLDMAAGEMHGPAPRAQQDGDAPTASDPSGSGLRTSLEKQGIRLVRRTAPLPRIVIDHMERAPTEN